MAPSTALRRAATVLLPIALSVPAARALADERVLLFADRDDDDANGIADGEQSSVPPSAALFLVPHRTAITSSQPLAIRGPGNVRVLADGKALPPGASGRIPAGTRRVELQATRAGRAEVDILGTTVKLSAIEIRALDGHGSEVDFVRSHASIQRTPPARLADDPSANDADPDALRFVVVGLLDDLPGTISLTSFSAATSGAAIDGLSDLPFAHIVCPSGVAAEMTCGTTPPIRAVADDIDRNHPLVAGRSIKAELGGALAVVSERGERLQTIRVGGPRHTPVGAIDRYRASLRMFLVRPTVHGPPPIGGDDAGALAVARAEVGRANALWGSCGITFGPVRELDVHIVDPPRPHLVALGCDHGLPASGGAVRVRVDGRDVSIRLAAGTKPRVAARSLAAAIGAKGFTARVSDNATIGAGAFGSSDVLVRRRDGSLAIIEPPAAGAVSTDATMTACIGRVDLEDGLRHFGDIDAIAGTVEERTLIKAFDDGDPSTIEVFIIPSFAGGGRIGESFIAADGGAIRNTVIEDRAGLRADRASFALAHELGHILLDEPGHPDDFGVDTPTRLMDADATNPSAYGPRRLLVDECARAVRQSGPRAPVVLLHPWAIEALGAGAKPRR